MPRYCDHTDCGVWPATSKRHPAGVRLCSACEARYTVLPNGVLLPKELVR